MNITLEQITLFALYIDIYFLYPKRRLRMIYDFSLSKEQKNIYHAAVATIYY